MWRVGRIVLTLTGRRGRRMARKSLMILSMILREENEARNLCPTDVCS